jgi:hypothetical protein
MGATGELDFSSMGHVHQHHPILPSHEADYSSKYVSITVSLPL